MESSSQDAEESVRAFPSLPPSCPQTDTTGHPMEKSPMTSRSASGPPGRLDEETQNELDKQLLQTEFDENLNVPTGYLQVGVLMIRWERELDDFEKHDQEIDKLKKVFENRYNYECTIVELHNRKRPQLQLHAAISNHVSKYDGPNSLLIIYYTGHGSWEGDIDDLRISASKHKKGGKYEPTALWRPAEAQLLVESEDGPESDVFVIMDCCFASNIQKGTESHKRTVELLAAAPKDEFTSGPGENSFTTALIAALNGLLDKHGNAGFATAQLHQEIVRTRISPVAMLTDRFNRHQKRIKLMPLDTTDTDQRQKIEVFSQEREESSLHIRFSLKDHRLSPPRIKELGRRLPTAFAQSRIPLRKIEVLKWGTVSQRSLRSTVQAFRFARRLKMTGERRTPTLPRRASLPSKPLSSKRPPTCELPDPPLAPHERQRIANVISELKDVVQGGSEPVSPT